MLLGVMLATEADGPPIRGFHPHPTIGTLSNMGTLDRPALASRHRAGMASDPFAMGRTALAILLPPAVLMKSAGQHQAASFCGVLEITAAFRSRIVAPTSA